MKTYREFNEDVKVSRARRGSAHMTHTYDVSRGGKPYGMAVGCKADGSTCPHDEKPDHFVHTEFGSGKKTRFKSIKDIR